MSDILKQILSDKSTEIITCAEQVSLPELSRRVEHMPPPRGFIAAIEAKLSLKKVAVIAEIKRASPSRGIIREHFDPTEIARSYATNGAACLSVLTDEKYFKGHAEYLKAARAACELPVLRKDFIIDPYQIYQAREMGADAILLIAAALGDPLMSDLEQTAVALGLDVLVEVHNEQELERALHLQTPLLGINNRNLRNFKTSLQTTISMLAMIPEEKIVVSESGIHNREDIKLLRDNCVNVLLIGEAFMRKQDPGAALLALIS